MALVESIASHPDDIIRENVEFYKKRIVLAKKMKKLLQARLYLSRTIHETRTRPSLPANLTKLELGLMEATNSYMKLIMERQLLNVAIQRSIQSTILFVGKKNFFSHPNLNFIEITVAEQMKRMLAMSRTLRTLKETTDRQYMEIKTMREKLTSRFGEHSEKLQGATQASFNDPDIMRQLHKKIRNIKLLSTLMSVLVAHSATASSQLAETSAGDTRVTDLILMVKKWRTPRTFEYYKNKCSD